MHVRDIRVRVYMLEYVYAHTYHKHRMHKFNVGLLMHVTIYERMHDLGTSRIHSTCKYVTIHKRTHDLGLTLLENV